MNNLDTSNYKGVRDFYPNDMFVQDYIHSVWDTVLQSYGYEHYSASILEPSELYEGKTSDEIVSEQTYTFTDRGGRRITLRPEMTPTVARMVAKKYKELALPLRWYSIPNVFRYERPQKGRLREHWQLNADIFGIEGLDAEAELIEISKIIMNRFGLEDSDFVIKVNDRNIIDKMMNDLHLSDDDKKKFRNLLDKKDKLEDFNQKIEELIGKPFNQTVHPTEKIKDLIEKLNARGINNVVFDPMLVRGFDYYTDTVFEIFDTNPKNRRSLFGGGRYNNLLEIFDVEKIPTVGFGMGDVTIREALELRGLIPESMAPAHMYICNIDKSTYDYSSNLANDLRKEGVDVLVSYEDKKVGDQIRKADKKGIPFIVCIGAEEIKTEKFKIKNLNSGEEKELSRNQISSFVKESI